MKRRAAFVLQQVAGQSLLVPIGTQVLDTNGLVTLNETGRYVWELLAAERTIDDLTAALVARWELDEAAARADVESFINEIDGMGLLEK
jgi:hypothetical protein